MSKKKLNYEYMIVPNANVLLGEIRMLTFEELIDGKSKGLLTWCKIYKLKRIYKKDLLK